VITGTARAAGTGGSGIPAAGTASPAAAAGTAGVAGAARSKKRSSSTGTGMTRVLFFSAATSTTVCSSRSWSAAGCSDITPAASAGQLKTNLNQYWSYVLQGSDTSGDGYLDISIFGAKTGVSRGRALALATFYVAGIAVMFGTLGTVFDFTSNFRLFAIENYNTDLPGALDQGKRYVAFDPKFPDNATPKLDDDKPLSQKMTLTPAVDIAALRASYYRYRVTSDQIKKVVFTLDEISNDGLDIDGLVEIEGQSWQKNDYTGRTEVKFCLDKPEEKLH